MPDTLWHAYHGLPKRKLLHLHLCKLYYITTRSSHRDAWLWWFFGSSQISQLKIRLSVKIMGVDATRTHTQILPCAVVIFTCKIWHTQEMRTKSKCLFSVATEMRWLTLQQRAQRMELILSSFQFWPFLLLSWWCWFDRNLNQHVKLNEFWN